MVGIGDFLVGLVSSTKTGILGIGAVRSWCVAMATAVSASNAGERN